MKIKNLEGLQWQPTMKSLELWNSSIQAKEEDNTISILEEIGENMWGEGVTAKRIYHALRDIGNKDVTVTINSPGGSMFEGLAIYNLLKEHKAKVTIKIIGLAASAASIIAMAGDEIQIAKSGFIMIHNAWVGVMGNKHFLREVADDLEPFDKSIIGVYADATGLKESEIIEMMDKETFLSGEESVEKGFATSYLDNKELKEGEPKNSIFAKRRMDTAMAKAGVTRSERRELFKEFENSLKYKELFKPLPKIEI